MTTRRTWFAAGSLCALAFSAASAHAAPPAADDSEARADALFREGTEKLDAGHVDEACQALGQSLRLDPKLGTLLNLGLCHEKEGKGATAWAEFTDAAAWAADAGQTDRRDFAHEHATALEHALVRVQLRLPATERMRVEIDGDTVPESRRALPLFVDPGHHVLKVTAPAKKGFVAQVEAASEAGARHGGTAQVVTVPDLVDDPAPSGAAGTEALPTPIRDGNTGRLVALSLGAASIVGFGVGVVLGAESLSDLGTASAHCSANGCDAEGLAAHDEAKSAEIASLVTFGVSMLALGTGAWLWVSARPKAGPVASLHVVPVVDARRGGLAVVGTW
jgi:hypothetical protein